MSEHRRYARLLRVKLGPSAMAAQMSGLPPRTDLSAS